jgi:hypothetical protein
MQEDELCPGRNVRLTLHCVYHFTAGDHYGTRLLNGFSKYTASITLDGLRPPEWRPRTTWRLTGSYQYHYQDRSKLPLHTALEIWTALRFVSTWDDTQAGKEPDDLAS